MARFMIVTLALLGWAFYELSDGADFVPPQQSATAPNELKEHAQRVQVAQASVAPAQQPIVVGDTVVTPASLQRAVASTPVERPALRSLAVVLGEAAETVTAQPVAAEVAPADIRFVSGSRVNVRNGPGTNYSIVSSLVRGTETEVLQDPGAGWVKIRTDEGTVGWMSAGLLTN